MEKKRNINMDVIRCLALFFVVCVHSFAYTGFYSTKVVGLKLFGLCTLRDFFMICVPLFMILSGYLMKNKKIEKAFYFKIIRVIAIYVFASICCVLFRSIYLGESYSLKSSILSILDFSGAQYAWYVEMYLGLFLIIPFLNLVYGNLENKKKKQALLVILFIITVLPNILNIFQFNIKWFLNPSISRKYFKIFPSWWSEIYPITYYFVGCYLREYELNIKLKTEIMLLIVFVLLLGLFQYYRSYNSTFEWISYASYNGFPLVTAVMFFDIFKRINFSWLSNGCAKVVVHISKVSYGAYLVSFIFDKYFYQYFDKMSGNYVDKIWYIPMLVIAIFTCSIILSSMIQLIYDYSLKFIKIFIRRYKKWQKKRLVLKKG